MNYQISDILSNPSHINDVPEEILQNWLNNYPFVPILHLYALKKKENYSDSDLHRTAFHLINREKLYYLLKSKSITPREFEVERIIPKTDETTPIQLAAATQEWVTEEITPISEINTSDTTTAISLPQIEETTERIEKKSESECENNLKIEENIQSNTTAEKPLSIADKILLEIQQIKAERAKRAEAEAAESHVDNSEQTKEKNTVIVENITKSKENESEEKKSETPITLSIQEEVIARIRKIQEERLQQQTTEQTTSLPIITEVLLENETTEIKKEEILQTSIAEETTQNTAISEEQSQVVEHLVEEQKPLTIQEEVIARIQKIQEERKQQLTEESALTAPTSIATPPLLNEGSKVELPQTENEIDRIENIDTAPQPISEILIIEKPTRENVLHEIENETQQINKQETAIDIKFIDSKNSTTNTNILPPPTDKTIEPIHTEFVVEKTIIENEALGQIFPEPLLVQLSASDRVSTTKTEYIEPEKIIPDKSSNEKITIVVSEIKIPDTTPKVVEVQNQTETILPDEYPTEVVENISKIIQKDSIFIPEIEEDNIEQHTDNIISSDKETPFTIPHEQSIKDQIITKEIDLEVKKEPHTFIEWLKLLDGNLQIQTTEAIKEPENWIEIPRYEVEQTLAQKKEIQREDQKLFEPNFEEGEVDLFNEIDEEVTKVATDSVAFKQDMMTETLAKIYQKQGKYDKALEIYNTLRLKFPEKNAYFAALIEKLEKEK